MKNCPNCGTAVPPHASFCGICGQSLKTTAILPPAAQHPPALSPTGLLPAAHLLKQRYHMLKQVGKGGFGAVYQAVDTHIGNRIVAVKEMSQSGLSPQEIVAATEAFQHEVFLLAGLKHTNLPAIYDYFTDAGHWYVVMEFIKGQTLETHLNNRSVSLENTLAVGVQLCTVLDYLHTRQPSIIFRDLKPANVMLTSEGHLYLIDFGIARHFKPGQTKDTIALGSPGYAAPEQYGKAQTTPRSDIYSLGALLHHMLTGNDPSFTPFRFAPPQLPACPPTLEAALQTLIMQMLDMDANQRPASTAIVKQELERITALHSNKQARAAYSLSSHPQSVKPMLPLGARISRQSGYAAPVRAVAWSPDSTRIASGSEDGVVQVWQAEDGGDMTGRKVVSYCNHIGSIYTVAWSPDGTRIASAGRDKTVQVWNIATATRWPAPFSSFAGGSKVFAYHGHTDAVRALAWSPNGQLIASAGNDHTVHVWHVNTKRTVATYRGHYSWVYTVAWSPDGTRIASAGRDKRVRIWDATTGAHIRTYRGHTSIVRTVAWSPDGQYIASAGNDRTVQVWHAETRDLLFTLQGHVNYVNSLAWSPTVDNPGGLNRQSKFRILSGSHDKTVIVWDVTPTLSHGMDVIGSPTYIYRGHTSWVWAAAWSPDGTCIASASDDKTVHVWGAGRIHPL